MLITTRTYLALQCQHCDKLFLHTLSRFDYSGQNARDIICECGSRLVTICRMPKGGYNLQLACPICESKHIISLSGKELWHSDSLLLLCENTGVEIGFIGEAEKARQWIKQVDRSLRDIAEELGYDKYFVNADIMYQVIETIRKMISKGLVSCTCGSRRQEIEVYPDRIELLCCGCEATGIVFAETVKDLQAVFDLREIKLEADTYQYLDRKHLLKKSPLKK